MHTGHLVNVYDRWKKFKTLQPHVIMMIFLFPSCFSFLQIVCILKSTKNPLCPEGELAASEQSQDHFYFGWFSTHSMETQIYMGTMKQTIRFLTSQFAFMCLAFA